MQKECLRAAILSSAGIGDGLMMLIAAHHLFRRGYHVTLFQDALHELERWFPYCHFAEQHSLHAQQALHFDADVLIVQYDHRPSTRALIEKARKHPFLRVIVYYPAYDQNHLLPEFGEEDAFFSPDHTMVDNIALALQQQWPSGEKTVNNGMKIPKRVQGMRRFHGVVLHPTSTTSVRTWTKDKFLKVGKKLRRCGMEVAICVHPKERDAWKTEGLYVPKLATLDDVAQLLVGAKLVIGNESGIGHLASNLGVRTLIISGCARRMRLWRPGWTLGDVITPPRWVPNCKKCRLRTKKWQRFIRPQTVLSRALKMIEADA